MGAIITSFSEAPIELAESSLVGRHWRCDIRLPQPSVPQHWLELRWHEDTWSWRALTAAEHTRGVGATGAHGWRRFHAGTGRQRVRLGQAAWIALSSDDPPATLLRDLRSTEVLTGDRLLERYELVGRGMRPRGSGLPPTPDGDLIVDGPHVWRVCVPRIVAHTPTRARRASLTTDEVCVRIDEARGLARFTVGTLEVMVSGEPVRTLTVYARERTRGGKGWLDADTAWRRWLMSGGNAASGPERLGWDRGKIRRALRTGDIDDVGSLFEKRRLDGEPLMRLGLTPDRIEFGALD